MFVDQSANGVELQDWHKLILAALPVKPFEQLSGAHGQILICNFMFMNELPAVPEPPTRPVHPLIQNYGFRVMEQHVFRLNCGKIIKLLPDMLKSVTAHLPVTGENQRIAQSCSIRPKRKMNTNLKPSAPGCFN
ncbi:hypothetical protein D3C86_1422830 [compost metagenome]